MALLCGTYLGIGRLSRSVRTSCPDSLLRFSYFAIPNISLDHVFASGEPVQDECYTAVLVQIYQKYFSLYALYGTASLELTSSAIVAYTAWSTCRVIRR
jgi:hypothetical protein